MKNMWSGNNEQTPLGQNPAPNTINRDVMLNQANEFPMQISENVPEEMYNFLSYSTPQYYDDDDAESYDMQGNVFTKTKLTPIKRPGLVLKSPLAFQNPNDPSTIPIQKDGMAVCESCGGIGVKHSFYSREKRFCSLACMKGLNDEGVTKESKKELAEFRFKMESNEELYQGLIPAEPIPQLYQPTCVMSFDEAVVSNTNKNNKKLMKNTLGGYEWNMKTPFDVAPVSAFLHVPLADIWHGITVGMIVEVEYTDGDAFESDSFWVASVLNICGYKALLRFEGFASYHKRDFWMWLYDNKIHPVGWCGRRGKPLIPPRAIQDKHSDWKHFLVRRLTGARTLPSNFYNKLSEGMRSRFTVGLLLEVVDKDRISQVKLAQIHAIVGRRLYIKYYDSETHNQQGFWFHEDSTLIFPVGWAQRVGHNIDAPEEYLNRVRHSIFLNLDARDHLFTPCQNGFEYLDSKGFMPGMKLECVDRLDLSLICTATVMKVLNYGFLMLRIDMYGVDQDGADWFCYHASSPCLFPVGYCKSNNIPLRPPEGYDAETFDWDLYLEKTGYQAAPKDIFVTRHIPHEFQVGMKLEATDLTDPRLVCVATIRRVVDRLIKVSFDGWDEDFDQWLDCHSADIYPVGWCQMVGQRLEPPRVVSSPGPRAKKTRYKKKKATAKSSAKDKKNSPSQAVVLEPVSKYSTNSNCSTNSNEFDESMSVRITDNVEMHEFKLQANDVDLETNVPDSGIKVENVNANSENNDGRNIANVKRHIPRLTDGGSVPSDVQPTTWNKEEVAEFLRINNCSSYCDTFVKEEVDGEKLLSLTLQQIMSFTGMKVGPSLKIDDLIKKLRNRAVASKFSKKI